MDKILMSFGASFAALAVGMGAFGAHGLKAHLTDEMMTVYKTAVDYHMYHALALLGVAWAVSKWPGNSLLVWGGFLLLAGLIIFSGSLYILVLSNTRWLGAITPIGGVAFLAGWLCLAIGVWQG